MVRVLIVGFTIGLVVASVSCGKTDVACTAASCAGCCDSAGACQTGKSVNSCGTSGVACLICNAGDACDGTRCTTPGVMGTDGGGVTGATDGGRAEPDGGSIALPACNTSNCTGCCDGNVCQLGSSKQSCGARGGACAACSRTDSCVRGTCVTLSCSEATCPDGCCDGTVCRSGNVGSACGRGGSACITCGTGLSCQGGVCASEVSCSATNCPNGCCKAGTCFAGSALEACGAGGQSCQTCDSNSTCSNRTCTVKPCGPSTCAGCCTASGQCSTGTTTGACGLGGGRCIACSSTEACSANGLCVDQQPQCDSTNCAGCCFNGLCESGTSLFACGNGGALCVACAHACSASGSCLPPPSPSDAGTLPTGSPCESSDECEGDLVFKLGVCETAFSQDGGARGYPGGYCSSYCLFTSCSSGAECVELGCLATCTGTGRGSCRAGYLCDSRAAGQVCVPNCRNAGYQCPSSRPSCSSAGYCR